MWYSLHLGTENFSKYEHRMNHAYIVGKLPGGLIAQLPGGLFIAKNAYYVQVKLRTWMV